MTYVMGIHDHAVGVQKWLDTSSSYTWLRALEELSADKKVAVLATRDPEGRHTDNKTEVCYSFLHQDFSRWTDLIIAERPDKVLFNVCYYSKWEEEITRLRQECPETLLLARIHHDVRYLSQHDGFLSFVRSMDQVIVPSTKQKTFLAQTIGKPISVLPFSANIIPPRVLENSEAQRLDLVSTANGHPARNYRVIKRLIKKLNSAGFRCENIQGVSRESFHEKLHRARYFLLPSLTEASGSRVLIESLKANCVPIVFEECLSAVEILQETGVTHFVVASNLKLDFKTKKVSNKFMAHRRLFKQVYPIISSSASYNCQHSLPIELSERHEIDSLKKHLI